MGNFDDLIPKKSGGNFDDLIPKKKESPRADFKSFAFGGAPGFSVMPGSEDVLPAVGQTLGEPGGFGGAVGGAALGIGARDIIKGVREGNMKPAMQFGANPGLGFADPQRLKETGITAVTEGAFRAIPHVLFPQQFGGKAREAAGRELGEIAKNVEKTAPFSNTPQKPLIADIDQAFKDAPFERGPAIQALANAKKKLVDLNGPLTFGQARQLEQQLGREAQFATDATQGHFVKAPKAPQLNSSIKALRSKVSGKVDEMAAQAGYPEFESVSKKFGELARKYPESELQKLYSPTGQFIRGAAAASGALVPAAFGAGPLSLLAAPVAGWASLPPRFKTAIFRNLIDTSGGKAAGQVLTKSASELARRISR